VLLDCQHSMAVTKGFSKLPGSDFLDSVMYRPRTIKASGPVLRGVEPVNLDALVMTLNLNVFTQRYSFERKQHMNVLFTRRKRL
jgi:hypothetical protein